VKISNIKLHGKKNLHGSSRKVCYSKHTLIKREYFIDTFANNPQIPNFMKIRPARAELFHADRHDITNSRLSQFCERA